MRFKYGRYWLLLFHLRLFSDWLFSLLLGVNTALLGRVVAWSLWYFHNQFLWHADTSTVASALAFAACFGQDWPVARSTYQQVRSTAQAVAGLGHMLGASSVTSTLHLAKTCSTPAMDWLLGTKEVLSFVQSLTIYLCLIRIILHWYTREGFKLGVWEEPTDSGLAWPSFVSYLLFW